MTVGSSVLPMIPVRFGSPDYVVPLVVITAGYALFRAANNTSVMKDVCKDQRGVISASLNLTAAGWEFSAQVRRLINELKLAVESALMAAAGRNGHLRLGLIASLSRGALRDVVSQDS